MPRTSRKRRSPASFARKRKGSTKTRRVSKRRRSGTLGDIHSFKGIINAGVLSDITAGTSTHLGGQYVIRLTDLPIYTNFNDCFDFVRLNRCRMEFMPRLNTTNTVDQVPTTFITGVDEVPIVNGGALVPAPTWGAQGGDDAGTTESEAYDHVRITPDYIRGMPNCKETEIYKKHVHSFIPTFYNPLIAGQANPATTTGIYAANRKKWINLNYLQSGGGEIPVVGPDFYGPMYAFTNNSAAAIQLYDVKLHYSISFRRPKGF